MSAITRTLLASLLASTLLFACGGGERPPETVVTRPLAMPMRAGETDVLRYVVGEGQPTLSSPSERFGSRWLDSGFGQACAPAAPNCEEVAVTADDTDGDRQADRLSFPFTYDPNSRESEHSYVPVNPFPSTPATAPPAIRMAAGEGVSAAIDADGQVWVWGDSSAGLLGRPEGGYRSLPHRVVFAPALPRARALDLSTSELDSAWGAFIVVLDENRRVWLWGNQALFGDGEPQPAPVQVPVGEGDVIAVAAGGLHALALREDGSVWAWGRNGSGQLGAPGEPSAPVRVEGLPPITAIAAGFRHSMALDRDGRVWTWGSNSYGQLGSGNGELGFSRRPLRVEGIGSMSAIDAGPDFSIALRSDGLVWAWGRNDLNQLGAESAARCSPDANDIACSQMPLRSVADLSGVDAIAAGGSFGVARQTNGSVWAWGDNAYGQLGGLPGLASLRAVPVPTAGPALTIAAGARHALASPVDSGCPVGDGRTGARMTAWGDNFFGERGDGTAVNAPRATPVLTLGDDDRCTATIGRRLVVMLAGTAGGQLQSSEPGLACTVSACWQTVADGTSVTLTAVPAADAELGDWRWDCVAGGTGASTTLTLDAPRHCKLRFMVAGTATARQLSVAVSGAGRAVSTPSGIDCADAGGTCAAGFAPGQTVALEALPAEGWRFLRWGGDFACDDGVLVMSADFECEAIFREITPGPSVPPNPVPLTVQVGAGGRVTSTPAGVDCQATFTCQALFEAGTRVQLSALPAEGYRFVGYAPLSGLDCGNGDFVIESTRACIAVFEQLPAGDGFQLTVQRTGGTAASGRVDSTQPDTAIACGETCSALYPAGTIVVLRPQVLAAGVFFSHFTGCTDTGSDSDGTPLCFVLMNGTRTIQADFE
ncbi:MAG: hypothetical protein KF788_18105 [Piscinibacter sp.]|nr:hypothetical protein [Piscinibacter sp.]